MSKLDRGGQTAEPHGLSEGFGLYTVTVPRSVSCFNMITDCCSLGIDRGQGASAII